VHEDGSYADTVAASRVLARIEERAAKARADAVEAAVAEHDGGRR
jgi:hypothetical protein